MKTLVHCKHAEKQAPPHRCPYQNDANNNDDPEYCTCCEDCQQECADGV